MCSISRPSTSGKRGHELTKARESPTRHDPCSTQSVDRRCERGTFSAHRKNVHNFSVTNVRYFLVQTTRSPPPPQLHIFPKSLVTTVFCPRRKSNEWTYLAPAWHMVHLHKKTGGTMCLSPQHALQSPLAILSRTKKGNPPQTRTYKHHTDDRSGRSCLPKHVQGKSKQKILLATKNSTPKTKDTIDQKTRTLFRATKSTKTLNKSKPNKPETTTPTRNAPSVVPRNHT